MANFKAFFGHIATRIVLIILVMAILAGLSFWVYKTPFFNFKKVFHTYNVDNATKHILIWTDNPEDGNSFFGDKTGYVLEEQV